MGIARSGMKADRQKYVSLRVKLALTYTALAGVVILVFGFASYQFFQADLRGNLKQELTNLAEISVMTIDGDAHSRLVFAEDTGSPEWQQMYQTIQKIVALDPKIDSVYTMRKAEDGQIVFIADSDEDPYQVGTPYLEPSPLVKEIITSLDEVVVEPDFYTDEFGTYLSAYVPVYRADGTLDGVLGVDITVDAVLAQERRLLMMIGLLSIGAVFLAFFVGSWIANEINKPVKLIEKAAYDIAEVDFKKLTRVSEAIARGDLTGTIEIQAKEVPFQSADELGDLARALNTMIGRLHRVGAATMDMSADLQKIIGEMIGDSQLLNSASQQLADIAAQSKEATYQIALTMQQIAIGTSQQSDSSNKTAAAVEQMSHAINGVASGAQEQTKAIQLAMTTTNQINESIQQVASNALEVRRGAEQAAASAKDGAETVQKTIEGMQTIQTKVGFLVEKVQEVGESSKKIGNIVEVIEDISSQTNLLSLNAAIEAARAGEAGKGFAVVADEVRKLADRSSQSTKEVAQLVKTIQKSVTEAMIAMQESAAEVEHGVANSRDAEEGLKSILIAIEAVNQQAGLSAKAAQKMESLSNEMVKAVDQVLNVTDQNKAATEKIRDHSADVTESIENIASVSEQNSASVEEVTAAVSELSTQVNDLNKAAQELSSISHGLFDTARTFKLKN